MFDAQAYYKSINPPEFVDPTGKKHIGRIVGADTWFSLQTSLRSPMREDGTVDQRLLQKNMRAMVNAFFPRPWYTPWRKSVAYWMWQMPAVGRMRAVWDFMHSQANAMGTSLNQLPGTFPTSTAKPAESLPEPQTSGLSPSSTSTSPDSTTLVA